LREGWGGREEWREGREEVGGGERSERRRMIGNAYLLFFLIFDSE
jgi:hypothetical protein